MILVFVGAWNSALCFEVCNIELFECKQQTTEPEGLGTEYVALKGNKEWLCLSASVHC